MFVAAAEWLGGCASRLLESLRILRLRATLIQVIPSFFEQGLNLSCGRAAAFELCQSAPIWKRAMQFNHGAKGVGDGLPAIEKDCRLGCIFNNDPHVWLC